jgi:hypothetical protein
MDKAMSAQEKKWQAEEDARTLARAQEIANSPSRLKAAIREAKRLAADTEKQAKAARAVAMMAKKEK